MAKRSIISEDKLESIVGGNLTYTWFGGVGECGLNQNHKWCFSDIEKFESMLTDCMINKGMSDVDTLKAMIDAGIIWKK